MKLLKMGHLEPPKELLYIYIYIYIYIYTHIYIYSVKSTFESCQIYLLQSYQ